MTQVTLGRGHTDYVYIEHRVYGKVGKRVSAVQQRHIAIEMIEESAVSGIEQCCHRHKQHQHNISSVAAVKEQAEGYQDKPEAARKHREGREYYCSHCISISITQKYRKVFDCTTV